MPQEHAIAAKATQARNAVWSGKYYGVSPKLLRLRDNAKIYQGFASCIVRVVNLLGDVVRPGFSFRMFVC